MEKKKEYLNETEDSVKGGQMKRERNRKRKIIGSGELIRRKGKKCNKRTNVINNGVSDDGDDAPLLQNMYRSTYSRC
jgi:hypothetical protein